jgi:PAS domain S-box-containing protein
MRLFHDLPIRKKLTVVIILASAVALVLAGVASAVYETSVFQRAAFREAAIEAELIGAGCAPALARGNSADVRGRLSTLQSQEQIISAQIFDRNGALFAEFAGDPANPPTRPHSLRAGQRLHNGEVVLIKPLTANSQPVGTLVLHTRTDELKEQLRVGLTSIAVALMISTLIVLLLSWTVQRTVSNPIRSLGRLVKSVEAENNFSLRASKSGNDEIGALVDGVNRMLEQIQQHEKNLQASEERFRQVTESIQEVFWMTDTARQQMIYVSPSYEEIWGRSCASRYRAPMDWLEAVHPDDRDRIFKAAMSKQTAGTYDEEYRVVRPDGSVRWIRDRAFPVFDKNGQLYRLAGIAEDITERKRLECEVLEISDHEQERIGQDLHDGLCQYLASIAMTANLLKRRLMGVSNPEARIAEKICSQLEDAIAQARSLARGVSSLDLADDNLSPALHELASAATREYGVPCQVDSFEPISFCNPVTTTNLYRIAREAVYNAAKHARPSRIRIELKTEEDTVCLKVSDDGVGINTIRKNGLGMGLGIMKYRASMIGAELKIEKAAKGGTVMTCNLPRNFI